MRYGTVRTGTRRLSVVSRAFVHAQRRRRQEAAGPDRAALVRLQELLAAHDAGELLLVDVPCDQPPWLTSGIQVQNGDEITTFAVGRVEILRALDMWVAPPLQLWFRVGRSGPVFRGTREANTFTAENSGSLDLGTYFPGAWGEPSGTLRTAPKEYRRASGSMSVLLVRWAPEIDSDVVLRSVAGADVSGLVATELDRRATRQLLPDGWAYMWELGESEMFRVPADGAGVECHLHRDTASLGRDIDFPLTETTRLRWSWRMDKLPSDLAEDTLPTHDYLAIALWFDNGEDLSWCWSSQLPVGYSYACPIPAWNDLETHLVTRTSADLGRWISEDRPVMHDYTNAAGRRPPVRITRVGLVAVTAFQHGSGHGAYADIELVDGERRLRLLAPAD